MIKAVQQFQLRTVIGTQKGAEETIQRMKVAGYDGIELCSFMINKMSLTIRMITRLAGMPMGKSGRLDWHKLIAESGLKVVSIHEDLGSILKRTEEVAAEAKSYNTKYVVVTGMHHFDFMNEEAVNKLIGDLNEAGKKLADYNLQFLYHNHNCEFRKLENGKTAYEMLVDGTNPDYVNFEFDSYWPTEAGVDAADWMERLGRRMKLYHINDRGSKVTGPQGSILKSDSMELGFGNMNLTKMVEIAKKNEVDAIILESHRNWIDKSPIHSFERSAEFLKRYVP